MYCPPGCIVSISHLPLLYVGKQTGFKDKENVLPHMTTSRCLHVPLLGDKVLTFQTLLLTGKDIIGLAETGSGKTGAFALPVLQTLLENPQRLYALILTPTRFVYLIAKDLDLKRHFLPFTSVYKDFQVPNKKCSKGDDGNDSTSATNRNVQF